MFKNSVLKFLGPFLILLRNEAWEAKKQKFWLEMQFVVLVGVVPTMNDSSGLEVLPGFWQF